MKRFLQFFGLKPMGKMTIQAVIIHADGSKTDLGTVAKGKVKMETRNG